MRSNALYFPYIAVPDDTWTAKSLLYWDKLSSIVPMDYLERPEQMSDFMRALLIEGLVEPVIPAQHIHQIRHFDDSFIDLVEHRLRQRHQPIVASTAAQVPTRIHAEKLGEIPGFLVESGLARQVDWAWYDVETVTANQFMAYLAACLGAIPEVNATPVTDKAIFASGFQSRQKRSVTRLHQHKSREVVLRHLLPTPAGPVQVDKLVLFKRRYGHLLPPLRARVEAHCAYVATLSDPNERISANDAFLLNSKESIAEIEEAMRPTFGKIVLGSLAPLFGAGLSLRATALNDVTAYTGAALSLAGAAYQAIASIRGGRALASHPLAYVAHAKREFRDSGVHRRMQSR